MGGIGQRATEKDFNMKILVITDDFPPNIGGIAVFVHNLCLQLCRLGHQVDVLSVVDNARKDEIRTLDKDQPYRVYRYGHNIRPASILSFAYILSLQIRNRYDVLFMGHFFSAKALGVWFVSKLFRIPYAILSHGNDYWRTSRRHWIDRLLSKRILKSADLLIANSIYTAQRFNQAGVGRKIEVLTPGVDDNLFHPNVSDQNILKRFGVENKRIILTVARLVPKKNIENIIRAMILIKKKCPNTVCIVVGEGEDRKRLEILADSLELSSHVVFTGSIDHRIMPSIFCASDIFLMPSLEIDGDVETFGMTFLEANACAKPVIASDGGGMQEAVINGQTGILVDPGNIKDIAGAVINLLENSDLRKKLGANGLQRVKDCFTWEKVGIALNGYLSSCYNKDTRS